MTRALAWAAGVLACAGVLAAWLSTDVVLAWTALASFCG
jgi:hypothetical protein